jgi:RHS repeat-associated protein
LKCLEKCVLSLLSVRKVNAGDKIDAVAWTRFEEKASFNKNFDLIALSSLLGSSFVSMAGFEGYTVSQAASNIEAALLAGNFPDDGAENNRPFAYLSYIVYDNNMDFVDAGWVRVPEAAGTSAAALYLPENKPIRFGFESTITVEQAGYVYIWVSNQSEQARVWFDDVTVTHTQTMVTQATDYGVWGDVLREMKAAEFTYRFGYQGQFAEKDEETGWNHFELRQYDAVIGRWLIVDPKRVNWSPYVAMSNDPVNKIDPDGGCPYGDCDDWWDYGESATMLEGVTVSAFRWFGGGPFDRAVAIWERNGWNYSTYGNINFGVYSTPQYYRLFQGYGVSASAIVPFAPSPFFSLDRVYTDGDNANDLYLTMGLGQGLDISAGAHGIDYSVRGNKPLTSGDIAGLSVHFGGGYIAGTYQQSFSVEGGEKWYELDFGRVRQHSYGVAVSPHMPVVGSGRIGMGYTFNLSRIGRWLGGY